MDEAKEPTPELDHTNWVDPDILAYYGDDALPSFDYEREKTFRDFFTDEWQKPEYDYLHDRWTDLIESKSPHTRLYGKTALWSLIQLRKLKPRTSAHQDEVA